MIAIETPMLILWIVFGAIGWIRGFFRELGVTLIAFATVLTIWLIDQNLTTRIRNTLGNATNEAIVSLVTIILIIGILAVYQGQTISYSGKDPQGCEGIIFGVGIGLVNGWLLVGTWWYYLHRNDYPFVPVSRPLSAQAQWLISILPFNVIPQQYILYVLIAGLLFLLLLRIIR